MSAGARRSIVHLALLAALLLPPLPTAAVIIASGDGTGNIIAPPDDFGFANVGTAGQSIVYLGRGWVITANHVPSGPVTLADNRYEAEPGSRVRLENLGQPGPSADVALFRLRKPWPELPELRIADGPPRVGQPVVLVGNGPERGEPVEHRGIRGWSWLGPGVLRWGTNRVEAVGESIHVGAGSVTTAFMMDFSPDDATPHESQVATGDSGGAAFIERDGAWELAGVIFAARGVEEQPSRTSLYGNLSFAADLSAYRDQIVDLLNTPAPPSEDTGTPDSEAPDESGGWSPAWALALALLVLLVGWALRGALQSED